MVRFQVLESLEREHSPRNSSSEYHHFSLTSMRFFFLQSCWRFVLVRALGATQTRQMPSLGDLDLPYKRWGLITAGEVHLLPWRQRLLLFKTCLQELSYLMSLWHITVPIMDTGAPHTAGGRLFTGKPSIMWCLHAHTTDPAGSVCWEGLAAACGESFLSLPRRKRETDNELAGRPWLRFERHSAPIRRGPAVACYRRLHTWILLDFQQNIQWLFLFFLSFTVFFHSATVAKHKKDVSLGTHLTHFLPADATCTEVTLYGKEKAHHGEKAPDLGILGKCHNHIIKKFNRPLQKAINI